MVEIMTEFNIPDLERYLIMTRNYVIVKMCSTEQRFVRYRINVQINIEFKTNGHHIAFGKKC